MTNFTWANSSSPLQSPSTCHWHLPLMGPSDGAKLYPFPPLLCLSIPQRGHKFGHGQGKFKLKWKGRGRGG
jgi:hypothetical protein